MNEICGRVESSCTCVLSKGHIGSCGCDCGGRWLRDDAGNFHPVEFPQIPNPHIVPEVRDDYDQVLAGGNGLVIEKMFETLYG